MGESEATIGGHENILLEDLLLEMYDKKIYYENIMLEDIFLDIYYHN